jgi:2,3,4,5-tetrahydropyridine-2-carboxylate N-succinyltransferase
VKPHGINLKDIFNQLPNVAHTSEGPIALDELSEYRLEAMATGYPLHIYGVDKFPRMVDYVVPSGVRIADASRVRLGAYLGIGTTVTHEGFVDFNAGTLGKSMVRGHIPAGVVIGNQTDMGINSVINISLGDNCLVEEGLCVMADMNVPYPDKENCFVKVKAFSGKSGMTFRSNSINGKVEVWDQPNKVKLNEDLHKNE